MFEVSRTFSDLFFDNAEGFPIFHVTMIDYKQEQAKPIGVFDSGIGGLTVVHALIRQLPFENIVYFGDTARVPYGSKSPQTVRDYADQDTAFLHQQ